MTLIRLKASESDNQKHENDTCKKKGVWSWQFEKFTEMEERTQLQCDKLSFSVHTNCQHGLDIAHE